MIVMGVTVSARQNLLNFKLKRCKGNRVFLSRRMATFNAQTGIACSLCCNLTGTKVEDHGCIR